MYGAKYYNMLPESYCRFRNTMKPSVLGRACMVSALLREANPHATRFARLTRFCGSVSSRNSIGGRGKDRGDGRGSCELLGTPQVIVTSTGKGRTCAYICAKSSARRLSGGIGSVDDSKGRNERKPSACSVGRSTPIIEPKDLSDLNTEIASYVGSLGDPDFDVQEDLSLTKLEPGAPSLVPIKSSDIGSFAVEASKVNMTRNEGAFLTYHCMSDQKRLTLADDPSFGRLRTIGGKFGDTSASCDQISTSNDAGSFETLGIIPTSGETSRFMGRPKRGRDNDENKGTVNVEGGKTAKKRPGKIGSVMVLNGAACFIQGRLATTGESAVSADVRCTPPSSTKPQRAGLATRVEKKNVNLDNCHEPGEV